MTSSSKLKESADTHNILNLIKGIFWALSVSLIGVLIFAFILKFTSVSESAISPINQFIKILSIFMGCYVLSKKTSNNGWFWGLLLGAIYTLLAFIIFSVLDGEFRITLNLLNDVIFGAIIGLICGIITFALRNKS